MYSVYIIYSESFDRYYIGQARDVEVRIQRHNAGTEVSTQFYRPWALKWSIEKSSRAEAIQLERKLKNLSKDRIILFIKKHS